MNNKQQREMRNIKLTIQYDGTNYAGWQFQKNARSIQELIERNLKKILREKVNLIGSGRTDAGVHAEAQVANFKTRSKLPLEKLQMALNSNLPKDIVVSHLQETHLRFNAQHDAKAKLYRYTIANTNFVDPFIRRYTAKCFYRLDLKKMRKAAKDLVGRHDFTSFQTKDGEDKDAVRVLNKIKIEKDGDLIYIHVEADGFLYNMVRSIVGTLIEVGRGHIGADKVKEMLSKRDRRCGGPTAPASGLCLMRVKY